MHYTQAEIDYHTANFKYLTDHVFKNAAGVHPAVKRRIDGDLEKIGTFVKDSEEIERERKRRRTWADSSARTMYLRK